MQEISGGGKIELPSSETAYFFARWASSNWLNGGKVEKDYGVEEERQGGPRVC